MKYLITIFLHLILSNISNIAVAQNSSELKSENLKVIKTYDMNGLTETWFNKKVSYSYRGKKLSKRKYNKYFGKSENIWDCKPCLFQTYSIDNNNLIEEKVAYTACDIGLIKKYYTNGKINYIGNYFYDSLVDFNSLYTEKKCSIPDGEWIYFNEKGDTVYKEYWEIGQFIKQSPEQKKSEIWDIEIYYKDELTTLENIKFEELKLLKFKPLFKNENENSKIKFKIKIAIDGRMDSHDFITYNQIKDLTIQDLIYNTELPFDKTENIHIQISVFDETKLIKSFWLKLIE